MKAEDKPKYTEEAQQLLNSIDIDYLISNHNDLKEIAKINRLVAIFTDFSSNDGQELKRLFQEFQKWARRSTQAGTIKNRAVDVLQFIGQKIEEMRMYAIRPSTQEQVEKIKKKLKDEKLWVRSTIQGDEEHIFIGSRDDKDGRKVHLIVGNTGEIRVDPSDKPPGELLERVTSITTREDKQISSTRATLEFLSVNPDKSEQRVSVYLANRRGHTLLEIYNSGSEDLEAISVEAAWKHRNAESRQKLMKFIDENENPLFANPSGLNILRKGERKFAMHIPGISDDGLLRILISGKGVVSKKDIDEEFTVELPQS